MEEETSIGSGCGTNASSSAFSLVSLAGISRSTTVVVAYVMVVTELSCQEVLDAIRTIRPVANPNPGFRQQLSEFGGSAARKVGQASASRALLHG